MGCALKTTELFIANVPLVGQVLVVINQQVSGKNFLM